MAAIQEKCIACNTSLPTPIFSNTGILCCSCESQGLFRKRIAITGITRMNGGRICVSGIDMDTRRFVRPVFASGLTRDFVVCGHTQVFRHFCVVELEFKAYVPSPKYHTEDWMINESFAPKLVRHLNSNEILELLNSTAVDDLNAALRAGDRSLFVVRGATLHSVWHEQAYGKFKVRMNFLDRNGNVFANVPVTDLLILAKVQCMLKKGRSYQEEMVTAFNSSPYRFVRLGLTREFLGTYWKQVTGLVTIPDLFNGETFWELEQELGTAA